ncbi:MAG TPA: Spy/CpxP family protein refolding chaperone [Pyrinomonadaceae bacterium]|nr:Spy/CpxP family protein refolding chaperone [Pyrinomonadaceae bacterium]
MKLNISGKLGVAFVLVSFLLLIIFSTAQVFAQGEQEPPQEQSGQRPPVRGDGDLVRQLNLSPEQIEKIRAIREGNREQRRQIGQRIRAARQALDRAIYLENADDAVVEQRARELAEAQAAQVRLQALVELSVRRVLTPEQLQMFRDLRLRAEGRRRGRFPEDGARPAFDNRRQPSDGVRPPRQRRSGP